MEKMIPVVRHLEDINNLSAFGRDGGIVEGQDENIKRIANEIFSEINLIDNETAFLVTSPRNRAVETAYAVKESLKKMSNEAVKIKVSVSEGLRENDQGRPILPDNYNPGDDFEGFKVAGAIFVKETFGKDFGGSDNFLYRYADPVKCKDGSYMYPELKTYFSERGDSYRDVLVRVYDSVLSFADRMNNVSDKVKVVVVTHSQIIQILRDLNDVANDISKGLVSYEMGTLPRLCWEAYKRRHKRLAAGSVEMMTVETLNDSNFIEILKKERDHLSSL